METYMWSKLALNVTQFMGSLLYFWSLLYIHHMGSQYLLLLGSLFARSMWNHRTFFVILVDQAKLRFNSGFKYEKNTFRDSLFVVVDCVGDMEDIGLVKQGWKWLQSQKNIFSSARIGLGCFREKVGIFIERHWPMVCRGFAKLWMVLRLLVVQWRNSFVRGFQSMVKMGSSSLLIIMWSCFLSLTSMSCLLYVLLCMVCSWFFLHCYFFGWSHK